MSDNLIIPQLDPASDLPNHEVFEFVLDLPIKESRECIAEEYNCSIADVHALYTHTERFRAEFINFARDRYLEPFLDKVFCCGSLDQSVRTFCETHLRFECDESVFRYLVKSEQVVINSYGSYFKVSYCPFCGAKQGG